MARPRRRRQKVSELHRRTSGVHLAKYLAGERNRYASLRRGPSVQKECGAIATTPRHNARNLLVVRFQTLTQSAVLIDRNHRAWFEGCGAIHVELLGTIGASQQDIARYGDVIRYSHIALDYNSSDGLDSDAMRAAGVDAHPGVAVREDCCIARRAGLDGDPLRALRDDRSIARAAGVDAQSAITVCEDRCIARRAGLDGDPLRALRDDRCIARAAGVDAQSAITVREDRCIGIRGGFDSDALRAGCSN